MLDNLHSAVRLIARGSIGFSVTVDVGVVVGNVVELVVCVVVDVVVVETVVVVVDNGTIVVDVEVVTPADIVEAFSAD